MNQSFLNPFSTPGVPETVHNVLSPSTEVSCLCARFNPKGLFAGQYVATARADAGVAIYDIETRGMIRFLEGHVKATTTLAWSDSSRFLASGSADWNVVVWDLKPVPAVRVRTIRFDAPVAHVSFAPGSSRILLVVLESQKACLVDLRRNKRRRNSSMVVSAYVNGNGADMKVEGGVEDQQKASSSSSATTDDWQTIERRIDFAQVHAQAGKGDDSYQPLPPITAAKFHPTGAYIFAATTRGELLTFATSTGQLLSRFNASGASAIREIVCDRAGRNLVINSNDRSIRIIALDIRQPTEATAATPVITMSVVHRFQDLVNRTPWTGIGFSGDGEYVFAGAAHKAAHNIYVWDRGAGALDKILEGPREPLIDADWHPIRPLLLSVNVSGPINIWFTPNAENWSAYAPGFHELEENIEYQEGEDEFDLEDEEEATRRKQDEEEQDVDILTVGPLPGNSGAIPLPALLSSQDLARDEDESAAEWEYAWQEDPETTEQDFAIHVQLEEDDLDEDDGLAGGAEGDHHHHHHHPHH